MCSAKLLYMKFILLRLICQKLVSCLVEIREGQLDCLYKYLRDISIYHYGTPLTVLTL